MESIRFVNPEGDSLLSLAERSQENILLLNLNVLKFII
jgi:hypothetical protein